jgi:FAD dependent oxidoreductase
MNPKLIAILLIIITLLSGGIINYGQLTATTFNLPFAGTNVSCEVIVNGGTTAAYFAAYTAAKENKQVCLIEPTDWVGGQLTSSGVPAIDWQWNQNITPSAPGLTDGVNGQLPHTLRENNNFLFFDMLQSITGKGKCWVSRDCMTSDKILPKLTSYTNPLTNLRVFYNSVPKNVTKSSSVSKFDTYTNSFFGINKINNVGIIQRTPVSGTGYDQRLSQDINDWYSTSNSARFTKQNWILKGVGANNPVVIDASDTGDILALSNSQYLQGLDNFDGSSITANDQCGQSVTYPFNIKYNANNVTENGPMVGSFVNNTSTFNYGTNGTWDKVWNYRRLAGTGNPYTPSLAINDVSNMNWKSTGNNGNDLDSVYWLNPKSATTVTTGDWKGSININALQQLEDKSYSFYYWMKQNSPYTQANFNLDMPTMGTTTGLYKYPYIRDTRRSVGIDNYVLKTSEMLAQKPTGYRFKDRIATANYGFDIHPIAGCAFSSDDVGMNYATPSYTEPYPFYIPLRSLTNKSTDNLIVAGKNIAQSFKASAATRLQPVEATTGAAAGVLASYLATNNMTTYSLTESTSYNTRLTSIQNTIKIYQAIDWKINNVVYPTTTEYLTKIKTQYFCPQTTVYDPSEGFCADLNYAYGPFSQTMINNCISTINLPYCNSPITKISNNGKNMSILRYPKKIARQLRGTGTCMVGLTRDTTKPDYCVEIISGVKNVYGPFTQAQVATCFNTLLGGNACYNNRFNYNFVLSIL